LAGAAGTEAGLKSRAIFRLVLALFFIGAGVMHFLKPEFYLTIMPAVLPHPLALVYISGVFEILGGVGVMIPATRRWAGYGLIALLIAVFPANIKMFHDHLHEGFSLFTVGLFLRLPLQIVLIVIVEKLTRRPRLNEDPKRAA
jgi:uncharacterized membrane protein